MDWNRGALLASLAAAVLGLAMPSASAQEARATKDRLPGQVARLREGSSTLAPFAFIRYCVANPQACRPGAAVHVTWTGQVRATVFEVNRRVNRSIRPRSEAVDAWSEGGTAGDCEDYALTKRWLLIGAGIPTSALRMAVATTAGGEGHAVLVVKTSDGDFVLDNQTNAMKRWNETGLRWLKIASGEDPQVWRSLF